MGSIFSGDGNAMVKLGSSPSEEESRQRPVSSIYIWSENLVAESEAKDGGN